MSLMVSVPVTFFVDVGVKVTEIVHVPVVGASVVFGVVGQVVVKVKLLLLLVRLVS